jgi:phage head maturation protease
MRLHGIASSTVKDRHGDTMNPSALSDMENAANNNLTIFLNHEYRVPEDVAGSVERAIIRSHPQDSSIHDLALDIIVNQSNERAVKAWEAINGGTQLGLSIGAMIPENGAVRDRKTGSYEINHVDLLETSLVGVPANPRSWVEYAVKSLNGGITKDESLDEMIEEVREDQADLPADETPTEEPAEEMTEEAITARLDSTTVTTNSAEGTFTLTPDIADATVSVETPFANITVDTGNRGGKAPAGEPSQEALASAPENEETDEDESLPLNPWAAIGLSGEPEVESVESELQDMEPTVSKILLSSSAYLQSVTRELIETKAAMAEAVSERDAAVAMTEKVLANTAEILARLSATPVGRRATVRQATEQFESLKSVYGDDFLTLLKKG